MYCYRLWRLIRCAGASDTSEAARRDGPYSSTRMIRVVLTSAEEKQSPAQINGLFLAQRIVYESVSLNLLSILTDKALEQMCLSILYKR